MNYNYKLTIAYDGTRYSGWQIQPNAKTIQDLIEQALQKLLKHPVRVIGSGRTDAGVHALGQVAHFKSFHSLDLRLIKKSLNGILPRDIRIKTLENAHPTFHAQYSSKSKIYHYHLYLEEVDDPFKRPHHLFVKLPLDQTLLREAARHFIGKKDFTSFANEPSAGSVAKNPVRTLKRLDVIPQKGGLRLEFEADGFLYKMVRNIVGTLLEVASGKRQVEDIQMLFDAKDRRKAGIAAPPQGLFLVKVNYSKFPQVMSDAKLQTQ